MKATLETRNVTRYFGAVRAADNLNVVLRDGELVGMMGANGAGKTTFLNLITGYVKPTSGRILYLGRDITGLTPKEITRLGVARSFQIPQLFPGFTALENLLLALASREGKTLHVWNPLKRPAWVEEAEEVLRSFKLAEHTHRPVEQLSEGARKLLDIAMAMLLRPRLLLMDEPTSGVSQEEKFTVMDTVVEALRARDVTALFVEHDTAVVQRYAQWVLVLHEGRVMAEGTPEEVFADSTVRSTVLGYAVG